jgi:2,3-bisphosphoglycerate-independent phosphoglycerate mutase
MANFELMHRLVEKGDSKLVLLILDGLGGLSMEPGGPTELEAAATPRLDKLAQTGSLGQIVPVSPGVTPGSGPSHLALFGYDPLQFDVGRGVIEAAGIGLQISQGDLAARGNFCTLDDEGSIIDRRAGRISTSTARPLVEKLKDIELPGVETQVEVLRDYRLALVLRGDRLGTNISETDPLEVGRPPLVAQALDDGSRRAAELVNRWIEEARTRLADEPKANGLTLRGFSTNPNLPQFTEIYGMSSACVAVYPMYRGVSRLVGMDVVEFSGEEPADEFAALERRWHDYDFFFIHIKKTDSLGEDGDFEKKARHIETVDAALDALLSLKPDVLVVTGDHSTPARLRYHSWHPVPLLLWSPVTAREGGSNAFGERECARGALGTFPSTDLMPLMLAHGRRLQKYGA